MFFDRPAVINAVDRASRKVLSKFGAFVMTTARRLIKKAPRTQQEAEYTKSGRKRKTPKQMVSSPGQPPLSHTGLLKDFILFGYDPYEQSVVIGPAKLNAKQGSIPEVLEKGGVSTIDFGRRRGERVNIEARPFMAPALAENEPKLPGMWADSVK